MMRKISIIVGLILFGLTIVYYCFAQTPEEVTITTYYPSPNGVYDRLLADKLGVGDNNNDGNYTNADVPNVSGDAWFEHQVRIGPASMSAPLIVKTDSSDKAIYIESKTDDQAHLNLNMRSNNHGSIYVVNSGGLWGDVALCEWGGNVGIGTTSPDRILNIGENNGANLLLTREDTSTFTNNLLGQILFDSTDGGVSSQDAPAMIRAYASESHGSGDKGGYLTFETKPTNRNGNQSALERMRLTDYGTLLVGSTSPNGEAGIYSYFTGGTGPYDAAVKGESTFASGVAGIANGANAGVFGQSQNGIGIQGENRNGGANCFGVYGAAWTNTSGSTGVYGVASATSGSTYGVRAVTNSSSGTALYAYAGSNSGNTYGIRARTNSRSGGTYAIHASAYGDIGRSWGIKAETRSSGAGSTGVHGKCANMNGLTYAILGEQMSPSGYSGYFLGGQGILLWGSLRISNGNSLYIGNAGNGYYYQLLNVDSSNRIKIGAINVGLPVYFYDNAQARMKLQGDLYVYNSLAVGKTTQPLHLVDLAGGAYCDGTGDWIAGSSRELKKDIQILTPKDYRNIIEKLKGIEVVRYRYKNPQEEQRLRIGVISEDAPEEFVTSDKKGMSTMDAVGFLLAAVKTQQAEIEVLKEKINKLEK